MWCWGFSRLRWNETDKARPAGGSHRPTPPWSRRNVELAMSSASACRGFVWKAAQASWFCPWVREFDPLLHVCPPLLVALQRTCFLFYLGIGQKRKLVGNRKLWFIFSKLTKPGVLLNTQYVWPMATCCDRPPAATGRLFLRLCSQLLSVASLQRPVVLLQRNLQITVELLYGQNLKRWKKNEEHQISSRENDFEKILLRHQQPHRWMFVIFWLVGRLVVRPSKKATPITLPTDSWSPRISSKGLGWSVRCIWQAQVTWSRLADVISWDFG